MSRALSHRLRKLEATKGVNRITTLVLIPSNEWPDDADQTAWEALRRSHPGARVFLPSQAESAEAWERGAGR